MASERDTSRLRSNDAGQNVHASAAQHTFHRTPKPHQASKSRQESKRHASNQQKPSQYSASEGSLSYAQYRHTGSLGAAHHGTPVDLLHIGTTNRQQYDLLGIASQHFNPDNVQRQQYGAHRQQTRTCPYHGRMAQDRFSVPRPDHRLGPMDRYLAESPSESYALASMLDIRYRTRPEGCTCFDITQGMFEGHDRA